MALTQQDLNRMTCAAPDCVHADHDVLVLRSRCHFRSATWTEYNAKEGTIRVFCSECDRTIATIAVATGVPHA